MSSNHANSTTLPIPGVDMVVSWNRGTPKIIHFHAIFHYIVPLEINHFWIPPFIETPPCVQTHRVWSLVPTAQCKRKDFEGSALHKDSKTRKTWTRWTRWIHCIHCVSERYTPIIRCMVWHLIGNIQICGCKCKQVEEWKSGLFIDSMMKKQTLIPNSTPFCPLLREFKCCFVFSPSDIAEKRQLSANVEPVEKKKP